MVLSAGCGIRLVNNRQVNAACLSKVALEFFSGVNFTRWGVLGYYDVPIGDLRQIYTSWN
jgi:hypothetical protein